MTPSYINSYASGLLKTIAKQLSSHLTCCRLCPHECKVNRRQKQSGVCQAGILIKIWRHKLHMQEEPPISGTNGSGIIFFSGCSGKCIYCQNYTFSNLAKGHFITETELARIMLDLQKQGAHNINLVSPTHYLPQIVNALLYAIPQGLLIPLVFNSSGYENLKIIQLLQKVIDIFLVDAKYGDDTIAQILSGFKNYTQINLGILSYLAKEYPCLICDTQGIVHKGLIIRHLVLPDNLSQTRKVLTTLKKEIASDIWISLMDQYTPAKKISRHVLQKLNSEYIFNNTLNPTSIHKEELPLQGLNRTLTKEEYQNAYHALVELGFENGWVQENFF